MRKSSQHITGKMRAIRSSALELSCHSHHIKAVPKCVIAELYQQQKEMWYITTWSRRKWASKPMPEDAQQMHTHSWDMGSAWDPKAENAVQHTIS